MGVGDVEQGVGWGGLARNVPWFSSTSCLGPHCSKCVEGSLVNNGPVNVFTIYWGPEEYLLAWGKLWESTSSVGLMKLGTLCLLVGGEVVSDSLHIYWLAGSTRVVECPIA